MISKFIFNAVKTLDPEGTTSISVTDDDTDKILFLSNPKNITVEQIIDKIPEVEAEDASQEYARNSKAEYDALNQFEMQYDDKKNSTTTWDDAIDAIKAKWPKDNSGPV